MAFAGYTDVRLLNIEFHQHVIFCSDTLVMKDFNYW